MRQMRFGDTVYFRGLPGKVIGYVGEAIPADADGTIPLPVTPPEVTTPTAYVVAFKTNVFVIGKDSLSHMPPAPWAVRRPA